MIVDDGQQPFVIGETVMEKISYTNRAFPKTVNGNAEKIIKLMNRKKVVSWDDMTKATGKSWMRRSFQLVKLIRTVEPVRKGRKLLGFTLKKGPGILKEKIPEGRFKIIGGTKKPRIIALNDGRVAVPVVKKARKRPSKKIAVQAPVEVGVVQDAA